jgi:hypothetical protein
MNLGTTRLRGRPRNRWQDEVREDRIDGEGWQEEVRNKEELKKFLRTARNRHILHMPMELMNIVLEIIVYYISISHILFKRYSEMNR